MEATVCDATNCELMSLCYASLPYISDSLRRSAGVSNAHHCVAVAASSLSSIMNDQVQKLSERGVKVAFSSAINAFAFAMCFMAFSSFVNHGCLKAKCDCTVNVSNKEFMCAM